MPTPACSDFDPIAEAVERRRARAAIGAFLAEERADADEAVIDFLTRPRGTIVVSPRRYDQLVAAGLAEPLPPVPRLELPACGCSVFETCDVHKTSDVEQNGRGEEGLHDGCALAGGGSEEPAVSCQSCAGTGFVGLFPCPHDACRGAR